MDNYDNDHFSNYRSAMDSSNTPIEWPNARKPFSKPKGARRHTNLSAICFCLWVPWLLFVAMYANMTFSIHYSVPGLCYLIAILGGLFTAVLGGLAFNASYKRYKGDDNADPTWFIFLFLSCSVALIAGIEFGCFNYWNNMLPFYDIHKLNAYVNVNPANTDGQRMMDVGRIEFVDNARVDLTKAMGFKNADTYCVAPITVGDQQLATYDFWAVGLNCCASTVGGHYTCGQYNNVNAHSALRLMRSDQRDYYRLAVQQAQAAYNIHSEHALFFYWMQDPTEAMHGMQEDGIKFFILGAFIFFAFQLLALIVAVVINSKIRS